MKTNRILISLFSLLLVIGISTNSVAQQAPKKAAAKSATKKPAAKKKVAKKSGTVFICDGTNGYTYHSRRSCEDLAKCKGRVLDMTKQEAIDNYGRKVCKKCN